MSKKRRANSAYRHNDHRPTLLDFEQQHLPLTAKASKEPFTPRTSKQTEYAEAITSSKVTFGVGPAGTGKTYVVAALAAEAIAEGHIERIIVTRPAVEAGESLGFLPGELDEKFGPFFRPVRDVLSERLGASYVEYLIKNGRIEAWPLAFMRGATIKNAIMILDEAQNTSPAQMKMFLTRIGEGSIAVVNGDPTQRDLPGSCGLIDAMQKLRGVPDISVVEFTRADVVRDDIVQRILERYEIKPAASDYTENVDQDGLKRTPKVA